MKCTKSPSSVLISLSVVALIITGYLTITKADDNLFGVAGTQWILVAIVLAVYAVYAQSCDCNIGKKE